MSLENTTVQDTETESSLDTSSFDNQHNVLPLDVLCGRDKEPFNHPGNIELRTIVNASTERYMSVANRKDRANIVDTVIERIHEMGGRFLKKDSATKQWFEIDKKSQQQKVSHAFRDAVRKTLYHRRKENDATTAATTASSSVNSKRRRRSQSNDDDEKRTPFNQANVTNTRLPVGSATKTVMTSAYTQNNNSSFNENIMRKLLASTFEEAQNSCSQKSISVHDNEGTNPEQSDVKLATSSMNGHMQHLPTEDQSVTRRIESSAPASDASNFNRNNYFDYSDSRIQSKLSTTCIQDNRPVVNSPAQSSKISGYTLSLRELAIGSVKRGNSDGSFKQEQIDVTQASNSNSAEVIAKTDSVEMGDAYKNEILSYDYLGQNFASQSPMLCTGLNNNQKSAYLNDPTKEHAAVSALSFHFSQSMENGNSMDPFSHNFSQLFESGYNTSIPLMESYVRELENHSIPTHSLDMLTTAPSDTRPDDQKVRSVQSDSFANEIENSFGPLKPEDLSELRVINPTRAEESPISDVSVDHI